MSPKIEKLNPQGVKGRVGSFIKNGSPLAELVLAKLKAIDELARAQREGSLDSAVNPTFASGGGDTDRSDN